MMPDRYGDDAEPTTAVTSVVAHNPDCRRGWLGTDLDGKPVPCLTCRPHLRTTVTTNDFGVR